jgi:hypothetical protein
MPVLQPNQEEALIREHLKSKINGKTYDTATASKIAEAARRKGEDFTSVLYRTPDGLFFVEQEEYNYGKDQETGFYVRIGGRCICPVTAEEALEWLGQRAAMPIEINPMEPPGPYEASFHTEVLKWLRGKRSKIKPGTVGEGWAEIAKDLVTKDPKLLKSSYKLRKAINEALQKKAVTPSPFNGDDDDLPF